MSEAPPATDPSPPTSSASRDASIRPFRRTDSKAVADLYEKLMRSGSERATGSLAVYFERLFLDAPWADPSSPALVYEESDGAIAGFLGVYPRPIVLDGRPLRMVCGGQLVVAESARARGVGARLTQASMRGTQDLFITDGATEHMGRIWERLGGRIAMLPSIQWTRVLRPARLAASLSGRSRPRLLALTRAARPLLAALDSGARVAASAALRPPIADGSREPLEVRGMLQLFPEVVKERRLAPHYDEAYLEFLLGEMSSITSRGPLVSRMVSRDDARPCGWFVVYLPAGGIGEAVQVAAIRGHEGLVLDHLFEEADRRGATAVRGRVESGLLAPLSERTCVLRYGGPLSLIHSRNPDVVSVIQSGDAYLTRLDGEWWTPFLTETFE